MNPTFSIPTKWGTSHFLDDSVLLKGYRFRGKYRVVKKVTARDLDEVKRDLDTERKNMFYLRNPFLLAKEFDCVPADEKKIDTVKLFEKKRQKRIAKFQKFQESRKLNYFLRNTLGSAEKWE